MATQNRQFETKSPPINKRTLTIWVSLLAAMSVASGLLILLEPRPMAPVGGLALSAVDRHPDAMEAIFRTPEPISPGRWEQIVVHHSGQNVGDAQSIGHLHQALGYGGLAYHFVIGNGEGASDGVIQVGYRWMRQQESVYAPRRIAICLVGNGDQVPPTDAQMKQLVRLVTALQIRLDIDAEDVRLHADLADVTSPGVHFPRDRFAAALPE